MDAQPKKKTSVSFFHKVSVIDIAISMRHLSIMLKSGIAIEEAIEVAAEQTNDPALANAFSQMLIDVRGGKSVTEAMEKHKKVFSDIVISIINVGEQGGTLEKNLLFLSDYLKKAHELEKKVKGAMIYPIIVLSLTVVEMLGMMLFILPKMETLFSSFTDIPAFTVFILSASRFLRDNGLAVMGGLVIAFFILSLFLKTPVGISIKSYLSLNFPIIKNLTKKNTLASVSRTLGILLESGLPLSRATEITAETVTHRAYKKILSEVNEKVKEGHDLSETLGKYPTYFDPNFVKMIQVGERTGSLEDNLGFLYDFYAEEVEEMSNNLSTLLEPILLIFVGAMIGVLAIIIIGPIYQLTGTIRNA